GISCFAFWQSDEPARRAFPERCEGRRACQSECPPLTLSGGEGMRNSSAILGKGGRSTALIRRLARDFMRPHAKSIAVASILMGLAAGSTAGRAWLMEPVLDRIFVAREGSLLLLIAGAALVLAIVKGLADYGEAVLMTRVGQRVIADVQIALFA